MHRNSSGNVQSAMRDAVEKLEGSIGLPRTEVRRGRIVVLSLVNPREKFWGSLLSISPSGVWLRGLDLGSFECAVTMIRDGEQSAAIEVFFPMHRVERMEADSDTNGIPTLQQRFEKATGQGAKEFLQCAASG